MAKRKISRSLFRTHDVASWNFIIFLTLAFILLVVVLNAMGPVGKNLFELRSRAGANCKAITQLPRPEDCPGSWSYKRDTLGCAAFFCETNKSNKVTK
ncbi:MAG: hypothetical protein AAB803_03045 [Patescibacteria group bacterium]